MRNLRNVARAPHFDKPDTGFRNGVLRFERLLRARRGRKIVLIVKVGVRSHFDSMHSLPGHPKCGVPHGHTYVVEVQVEGEPVGGIVVDFDALKSALREVLAPFDHADLNRLLTYPSCEAIAMEIHRRLKLRVEGRRLAVRVWEGEGKWAEYDS